MSQSVSEITRYATREQIVRLGRLAAMLEWSEIDALMAASLEGAAPDDPIHFAELTVAQADQLINWLWQVVLDAGDFKTAGGAA